MSFIIQPTSSVTAPSFTVITTSGLVAAGSGNLVNTSAGAFTLTLPAAPGQGSAIYFQDAAGTWDKNPLTINPNGLTIMGDSSNFVASSKTTGFGLMYNGSDWRIY